MSTEIVKQKPQAMELLSELVSRTQDAAAAVELAKSIVALQQSEERFQWEAEERQNRIDFDEALNRCQQAIGRVAPNQKRNDTHSTWADYAALDGALRPVYSAEGFSISFSEAEGETGRVKITASLSRRGIVREFHRSITPSTTGPKGNAMATQTDAEAIAASRAKRYLMADIFNISFVIDAKEKEGVPHETMPEETVQEWLDALKDCPDFPALKKVFAECYGKAKAMQDQQAKNAFLKIYEAKKREFNS